MCKQQLVCVVFHLNEFNKSHQLHSDHAKTAALQHEVGGPFRRRAELPLKNPEVLHMSLTNPLLVPLHLEMSPGAVGGLLCGRVPEMEMSELCVVASEH